MLSIFQMYNISVKSLRFFKKKKNHVKLKVQGSLLS